MRVQQPHPAKVDPRWRVTLPESTIILNNESRIAINVVPKGWHMHSPTTTGCRTWTSSSSCKARWNFGCMLGVQVHSLLTSTKPQSLISTTADGASFALGYNDLKEKFRILSGYKLDFHEPASTMIGSSSKSMAKGCWSCQRMTSAYQWRLNSTHVPASSTSVLLST